ncbi:hypothetical protein FHX37_4432 [Haloactinospora alba]|uniref:Uncharacterized protein n=1 Tax=Haloactinospora alba TaxID=405555 RepID=A0A543N795_9ACTN|nr:hypothetical protein FHX37_4432 [Haloactinospora alba]
MKILKIVLKWMVAVSIFGLVTFGMEKMIPTDNIDMFSLEGVVGFGIGCAILQTVSHFRENRGE